MARRLNFRRPRGAVAGAIIGAALGVVATFAVDRLVSGPQRLWWPPAAAVICGISGAVLGMLFAVEIEGEPEETFPPTEAAGGGDRHSTAPHESPRR
jgi:hypothetical protein